MISKQFQWQTNSIDGLLTLKSLITDRWLNIKVSSSFSEILDISYLSRIKVKETDWNNFSFWILKANIFLSPGEFEFIWMLLKTSRTRFSLTTINLMLQSLSDWLSILSLWEHCQQLSELSLKYARSEIENPNETIENEVISFRRKFGPINYILINCYHNRSIQ